MVASSVLCLTLIALVAQGDSLKREVEPRNPFLPAGTPDSGWRFIRGSNYDGHSPEINLADDWPPEGPPILWTRELGQGYSGIVADGNRVCTQYQTLGGQYVACFAADTGAVIWEHRYDWPFEAAGIYPGPRSTPTIDGQRVFFSSPNAVVECLDLSTGQSLWTRDLRQNFQVRGTDFGYACSPTVVEGLVVMPAGGPGSALVALDARTGKTVWQSGDDSASYTPAFPIRHAGKSYVVGYLQNAVIICELSTGRPCCRLSLSTGYDEHSAWPIYSEPYLWISGPFRGGSHLLDFSAANTPCLKTVWKEPGMSNDILSSVLIDGAIYGFDVVDAQAKAQRPTRGHFRCIDLLTGRENWSVSALQYRAGTDQAGTRIGHASVIVGDQKLFLFNDTGELILARANSERYEELGRATVLGGEIVWTPPTLHRGRLFLRNHSRAVCIFVGRADLLSPNSQATALRPRDIPQRPYRDWAGTILAIEPEYALDLPTNSTFLNWYLAALFGVFLPGLLLGWIVQRVFQGETTLRRNRLLPPTLVFIGGAVGTTLFSRLMDDFIFTWPVCLFVVFLPVVSLVGPSPSQLDPRRLTRLQSYAIVAAFLMVCITYFLICRRLSLLFEWAFLAGFPAAVPFILLAQRIASEKTNWRSLMKWLLLAVAFTAFYWSGVALLWLRY